MGNDYKNSVIDFFYDEYFKKKKGHDYTDEQITMSVNKEDIDDCVTGIKTILYKHFNIKEN